MVPVEVILILCRIGDGAVVGDVEGVLEGTEEGALDGYIVG